MRSLRGLNGALQVERHLRIWADGRGCSGGEKQIQKMTTISVGSNSAEGAAAL